MATWYVYMRCFPNFKNEEEVFNLYGVFNSGIMGGSRHIMLALLSRIMLYLDIASLGAVCDMTGANAAFHLHDYDRIYSGYPFSTPLAIGIYSQQGVGVTHKPGEVFPLNW